METTSVCVAPRQPKVIVEPGETFEVADSLVDELLRRGRFELVSTDKGNKKKEAKGGSKEDTKKESTKETKQEKQAREAKEAEELKEYETFVAMVDNRTPEQFEKLVENLDKALETLPESYREKGRTYVESKVEANAETKDTQGTEEEKKSE